MLEPVGRLLFNKRLNYEAFFYTVTEPLSKIRPLAASNLPYAVSLLSTLQNSPNPPSVFAWIKNIDVPYEHCIEQPEFLNYMQNIIRNSPRELEYLLGARDIRQGDGWSALVDERSSIVYGRTPEPEDIIGMCRVENGRV